MAEVTEFHGCDPCKSSVVVFPVSAVSKPLTRIPAQRVDYAGVIGSVTQGAETAARALDLLAQTLDELRIDSANAVTAIDALELQLQRVNITAFYTAPNGSYMRWDATNQRMVPVPNPVLELLTAPVDPSATHLIGFNASGAAVRYTPRSLAQLLTGVPDASPGQQLVRALGLDVSGAPVFGPIEPLSFTQGAFGQSSNFTLANNANESLATIVVPADGRYDIRYRFLCEVVSAVAEPFVSGVIKRLYTYTYMSLDGFSIEFINHLMADTPSVVTVPAGFYYGTLHALGSLGPFDLLAGQVLDLRIGNQSQGLAAGLQVNTTFPAVMALFEAPTNKLVTK